MIFWTFWIFRTVVMAAVLIVVACSAPHELLAADTADAVYVNAKIYTVDTNNSWADAMAVKDGKILAVGRCDGALRGNGRPGGFPSAGEQGNGQRTRDGGRGGRHGGAPLQSARSVPRPG